MKPIEQTDLMSAVNNITAVIPSMRITSQDELDMAASVLTSIRSLREQIAETFNPIIKRAHDAHKEAIDAKRRHDAPLEAAERELKSRIAEYMATVRAAEEERARREVEEIRLAQAAYLEGQGKIGEAMSIIDEPITVRVSGPRADGVALREHVSVEVHSIEQLASWAVANNGMARRLLQPNMVELKALLKQLGASEFNSTVPGCRAVVSQIVMARR